MTEAEDEARDAEYDRALAEYTLAKVRYYHALAEYDRALALALDTEQKDKT